MRNARILIYSLLAICIWCSCNQREQAVCLLEEFTVPEENHPEWTDLFTTKYTVTPLETNETCLIGEINKIKKFEGHYYISSAGKSILQFDEKGTFVTSLAKMGQGPEEYIRIEDFDVYEIDGRKEIWVSDNKSLKIYDAASGSFLHAISYPFTIHKFRRLKSSHILLVTGQSNHSLTLTDTKGQILSEYLEKEIPYLMFRPVQFVKYGAGYLFQLGISNAYISFNTETETFGRGIFSHEKTYLSDTQLLHLFEVHGIDFIREANNGSYINNIVSLKEVVWIQTRHAGKNYVTKLRNGKMTSTTFDFGTFASTITIGDSDESLLLYLTPDQLLACDEKLIDRAGNEIRCRIDDNPCLIEFFPD